ncbi:MAG: type IX secretion system plug protein domain-containing protein [Bacteroidota bacterium]
MKTLFGLLVVLSFQSSSQEVLSPRIGTLRVQGDALSHLPVIGPPGKQLTISFDFFEDKPADIRIKFIHCDKDWKATESGFVNDEFRNFVRFPIPFVPVPSGVTKIRSIYSVKFPGFGGIDSLPFSGNYMIELWAQEENELLGRARFFVVEQQKDPAMKVTNRYLPSESSPRNLVNKIALSYKLPDARDESTTILPDFFSVDVYRNRELEWPQRINVNDTNPNTLIEGWGTKDLKFIVDNELPGNEYRKLDLRNVDWYPEGRVVRSRGGADVSRYLHQGTPDHNGGSRLVTVGRYAGYVDYQFELLPVDNGDRTPIFVIGDFNGWKPSAAWQLNYNEDAGRYLLPSSIHRGVYDYAYVYGSGDLVAYEGNDWRTVNVYSAFIYYHDVRLGGYDRIVMFCQARSPGGNDPTSN